MWLTRIRFAHLLADFQSIRPTQSTWADAQRLMTRWGKWGHYDGACTPESCDYVIGIDDPVSADLRNLSEGDIGLLNRFHIFDAAERLGWRTTTLSLRFKTRNGIIIGTSTVYFFQVPGFADPDHGYGFTAMLGSQVRSRLRVPSSNHHEWILGNDEQLDDHPDWKVGRPGGCTGCESVSVSYTPILSPDEVTRLTSYNLACLTRLRPCNDLGDLLPAAADWHLYDNNSSHGRNHIGPDIDPTACHTDLRALGRDAEMIFKVRVLYTSRVNDNGPDLPAELIQLAKARPIQIIKGRLPARPASDLLVTPFGGFPERGQMAELLVPGHLYFVLFDPAERYSLGQFALPRCGVLEATPENLRRLSLGIAEDLKYRDIDTPDD